MAAINNFQVALVTGGCKSGKSNQALVMADSINISKGTSKRFVATCIPADEELKIRVAAHQETRGKGWQTIDAPYDLPQALAARCNDAGVVVVDCLTMWISNMICAPPGVHDPQAGFDDLLLSLAKIKCPVILVANEVGCGIVPDNPLARRFRDLAGNLNQRVARLADCVVWCVAGIPVRIK